MFYNSKAILFIHFLFAFGQGLQNKFAHAFNFGSLRFGIQIIWTQLNINITQPLFTLYVFQRALQTWSHEVVLAERELDQEWGVLGSSCGSPSNQRQGLGRPIYSFWTSVFQFIKWVDGLDGLWDPFPLDILWLYFHPWWWFWSGTKN